MLVQNNWLWTLHKEKYASLRLRNILIRLCSKRWNASGIDIDPFTINKDTFLNMKGAGLKSWKEFEELKNLNK